MENLIDITLCERIYLRGTECNIFGCLRIFLFLYTIKGTKHLHESSHFCFRDYCQKLHICISTTYTALHNRSSWLS